MNKKLRKFRIWNEKKKWTERENLAKFENNGIKKMAIMRKSRKH